MVSKNSSINRQILSLALPTLGFIVIAPLLSAIDTAFVGRLGTLSLASLGISSSILTTSYSIFIFLSYGTTSKVGKTFGAGKIKQAYEYGFQSIWLSIFIGFCLCSLLFFFAYDIALFLGVTEEVAIQSQSYIRASLPGLFAILISLSCVGILRGTLDTITPLIVSVVAAIIKVICTTTFIMGFSFGLIGAGIATSISEVFIAICLITSIRRKVKGNKINYKPTKTILAALLENIPLFIRSLTINASLILVGVTVAHFGTEVLAAHQIVYTVSVCIALLVDSVATASQSLIAVEMGRKNYEQLVSLTKQCFKFTSVIAVFVGIVIVCLSHYLPIIFTNNSGLQSMAVVPIALIGLLLPVMSFAFIGDGVLIGSGDTWYLAIAGILNFLVYSISLVSISKLVSSNYGLIALWLCMLIVFYGGRAVANSYRLFSYKWVKF